MVDMGALVGSVRRFGLEGPMYEVIGVSSRGETDEPRVRIVVVESGEELDYPVADLLADPVEG
jgi:hypothetical protein